MDRGVILVPGNSGWTVVPLPNPKLRAPRAKKSTKPGVPFEDDEAVVFAEWLCAMHIPHTHIANEIGGSTIDAKVRAIKAKRMGQTAGVWDYEIFLPIDGVNGEVDAYQEVRVELKRTKGGTVSPAQKKWGEVYEKAGIPCAICKGAEAAIKFVKDMIEEING